MGFSRCPYDKWSLATLKEEPLPDLPVLVKKVEKGVRNPARVYLAGLAKSGRRTLDAQLRGVAKMVGADSIDTVPWHLLKHEHVIAIRSKALELGKSPATGKSLLFYTENLL
jgi:hypothetical protein